jgi:hypothetical protein
MFSTHRIRALLLIAVVGLLFIPINSGAARTTVTVGLACYSLGHQRLQCEADAAGGSGSYSYQWTPTPSSGGQQLAIVRCGAAFQYQAVSVTVTDSVTAESDTASGSFFCGDAQ